MATKIEQEIEELEPDATEEIQPEPVAQQALTLDQVTALMDERFNTLTEKLVPKPTVEAQDTRTAYQIAKAQAEAQGIYSEEYVYQEALRIQSEKDDQRSQRLKEELLQAVGGLVAPLHADRVVTQVCGGDSALAAEVQNLMAQGVVNPQLLQSNEAVRNTVLNAARYELEQKRIKGMPGAAPLGSAGGGGLGNIRNQLTHAQREEIKVAEAQWGMKYTDEMIKESYGIG